MAEDGWTYRLRYVRCGKSGCKTCAVGFGHGPYWYAYQHRDGRMRSRYVGKLPPEAHFSQPPYSRNELNERWVFRGRMDSKAAMRILGFDVWPERKALQRRWRELVWEHHPDRGGNEQICAAINVAYGYLRR